VQWYRKAAEEGEPRAIEILAELCLTGECGVSKDPQQAAKWFQKGAGAGSFECVYQWGVCLATGRGVNKDYAEAAEAFRVAAEAGHPGAALDLGHCLMNGLGIAGGKKMTMAVRIGSEGPTPREGRERGKEGVKCFGTRAHAHALTLHTHAHFTHTQTHTHTHTHTSPTHPPTHPPTHAHVAYTLRAGEGVHASRGGRAARGDVPPGRGVRARPGRAAAGQRRGQVVGLCTS
jgi:hypothetical protein